MNELQLIERSPSNEVAFGKKSADALMAIVRDKKLARKFGGEKEHLFVEAWEILGQFAGLSAVINDAEPIEVDGVKGAKASVTIVDADQKTVGGAIAYCMRDEGNWKNKPWFQLASMAQTRAVSKAFRIKLGWVAVLAGYSGTPAEEMDFEAIRMDSAERKKTSEGMSKGKAKIASPGASQNVGQESWGSREEDLAEIRSLVEQTGTDETRMLAHYKLPDLDSMTKEQAGQAMKLLVDRLAAMSQ